MASFMQSAVRSLIPDARAPGFVSRFVLLAAAQVIGSGLSFVTAVIITRVSGAEVFGQISVGLAVLAYGLLLTNFGTDVSGVRAAAAAPSDIGLLLPAILLIRLAFALLAFALVLVFSPWLAPKPEACMILIIVASGVFAGACLPAWLPQSLENIKTTTLVTFGPFAITFVLTVAAALIWPDGTTYAFARLGGDSAVALALSLWAWRFRRAVSWPQVQAQIASLLRQSTPIAVSQLLRGFAFLTDILIVSFFLADTKVGEFSIAYRIYLLLVSVASMYFIIYFPRVVRAARDGNEPLRRELRQTLRWTIPAAGLAGATVMLIAPWFLPLAFGARFTASVLPLQVLAVAAILNFIHKNYSRALLAMGFPKVELSATVVATVVGVILKVLGTWQWGMVGAATAIMVGEAVLFALLMVSVTARLRSSPGLPPS